MKVKGKETEGSLDAAMWRSQVALTGAVAMECGGERLTRMGSRENGKRETGELVWTNLS